MGRIGVGGFRPHDHSNAGMGDSVLNPTSLDMGTGGVLKIPESSGVPGLSRMLQYYTGDGTLRYKPTAGGMLTLDGHFQSHDHSASGDGVDIAANTVAAGYGYGPQMFHTQPATLSGDSIGFNCYWDGSNYRAKVTGQCALIQHVAGVLVFYTANSTTAGSIITWINVGQTKPAMQNVTGGVGFNTNWADYGGAYQQVRYFRDWNGIVHLEGLALAAASGVIPTIIFTLPAGYRPAAYHLYTTLKSDNLARIDVNTSGEVNVVFGTPTNSQWISLEGISFAT